MKWRNLRLFKERLQQEQQQEERDEYYVILDIEPSRGTQWQARGTMLYPTAAETNRTVLTRRALALVIM